MTNIRSSTNLYIVPLYNSNPQNFLTVVLPNELMAGFLCEFFKTLKFNCFKKVISVYEEINILMEI